MSSNTELSYIEQTPRNLLRYINGYLTIKEKEIRKMLNVACVLRRWEGDEQNSNVLFYGWFLV